MLALAEQAVAEAPDSAEAHSTLSRAFLMHRDWGNAEREMHLACTVEPRGTRESRAMCGTATANVCMVLGCFQDQLEGARLFASQVPNLLWTNSVSLPVLS
jgi:uncharacterized protein HemY